MSLIEMDNADQFSLYDLNVRNKPMISECYSSRVIWEDMRGMVAE